MNLFTNLQDPSPSELANFDEIIDVRSPQEFAIDHIPGAVNLPVLNDEERKEVGTIYNNLSRFDARRIGAAHASRNIAHYLLQHFDGHAKTYRPLLYCWRGGMRSSAMATVLAAVGWQGGLLEGGYRTWRKTVVANLRENTSLFPFVLLDGQTGTNKTEILNLLAETGCQSLDLEGLAEHRGSVFGSILGRDQPSQKLFESRLWNALSNLDLQRPIVVEAESPKIGHISLPSLVLQSMRRAPRIELRAAASTRAHILVHSYQDLVVKPERLKCSIEYLRPYHEKSRIENWVSLVDERQYEHLASELMQHHYDPRYARQREKRNDRPIKILELASHHATDVNRTVAQISEVINQQTPDLLDIKMPREIL